MSASMSTHVSCVSRSIHVTREDLVYKEGFLLCIVSSSSSLHATSFILFGQSTSSPLPPFPLSFDSAVSATLVRHSPSLSDTSV